MKDKNILQDISYGMYIVTTKFDEKNVGCVINTLSQVTSENPIVSINVNKNNYTNEMIKKSNKFAVMILSEDVKMDIISTFGYKSSKDVDKFKGVEVRYVNDLPVVISDICGYIICDVINIVDCETHDIIIGRVKIMEKLNDKLAMTYKYFHEVLKGSAPKNAPTYKKEISSGNKYRCKICGYIYDNDEQEINFEDLPDTWRCPLCGAGKNMFEKI